METQSELTVEENGLWTFRGEEIVNTKVLNYFKENLKRDDRGFFVENRFGKRVEHGYLAAVRGFPRYAVSVRPTGSGGWDVTLDTGTRICVESTALCYVGEHTVAVILPGNVPARLSAGAMGELAEFLVEAEPPTLAVGSGRTALREATLPELIGNHTSSSERVDPSSSSGISTIDSPI